MGSTRRLVILLVALGLALVACGDGDTEITAADETADGETAPDETTDDETSDDETTVDDGEPIRIDTDLLTASSWVLRFGGGPNGDVPIVDGWPITITFSPDGTFGGTAACNGYGGTYTIDGSRLVLGQIGSNGMACEPDVMASESAFMVALIDVDGINLLDAELALSGPATELLFGPAEPVPVDGLLGQTWLLEAMVLDGEDTAVEGEPAILRIEAGGGFTGSTGCRQLSGRYVISGNGVLFNEMGAEGDCPTSLFDQDSRIIAVLEGGFVPTLDGDNLSLSSAGNEGLRYRAVGQDELANLSETPAPSDAELLDGIEWVFAGGDSPAGTIADPRTIDPTASITLTFTGAGTSYEGSAVCNAYGGDADIGDSLWTFTLGVPAAEEEGCGDELDQIVAAYLDALPQMNEGGVEGDGQRLVMNGNEIELHWVRAG